MMSKDSPKIHTLRRLSGEVPMSIIRTRIIHTRLVHSLYALSPIEASPTFLHHEIFRGLADDGQPMQTSFYLPWFSH
jgi:hypothetical protein